VCWSRCSGFSIFSGACCPLRKTHCLMRPLTFFFLKGLFPCHPHFPPPTAIHWSVPEFTFHPTCTSINPPLFIRTISHSLALWPRVLPARGSLSRLPYLRGVTDTAMISYYLNLLDSMATTVVVNARFYWILDTGSGWNEHSASLLRLSSDNSFDVI
jgi:hypothetical protein